MGIQHRNSLRLGLCCLFAAEPVRFRTTTVTSLLRLTKPERLQKLSAICLANANALMEALQFCNHNGIGSFRVNSQILPAKTHPQAGYSISNLPDGSLIEATFRACGQYASENGLRTVFHPDQFVVLNSPREDVVDNSVNELEYQAEVAEWIHADVINIHGGGGYGNKPESLARFSRNLERLSDRARTRLTVENDDRIFAPADLLPLCRSTGVPLVYDVHHHRCLPDEWSIEEATQMAQTTWNREPLFHISSPANGWQGNNRSKHHEYIDVADFPGCWSDLKITVEVEAKAKELAVARLRDELFALNSQVSDN